MGTVPYCTCSHPSQYLLLQEGFASNSLANGVFRETFSRSCIQVIQCRLIEITGRGRSPCLVTFAAGRSSSVTGHRVVLIAKLDQSPAFITGLRPNLMLQSLPTRQTRLGFVRR